MECVAPATTESGKVIYILNGIQALEPVGVYCPIVKFIFSSTRGVTVTFAASGGTSCNLASYDVFKALSVSSGQGVVPGPETQISGRKLEIASSYRGAMGLACSLKANGRLLNYLVREDS
jgi:hypothetical protein